MSNRLKLQDGKTLTLASLGGALEFYDFIVFLTFAPFLQTLFFPSDSPLLSSIMTYLTYAVAYFVRPLSGVIMAHFGDLIGRKKMFMLSLFLMAIPTLLIGLLPTYETIGILAPVLLALARFGQGLGLGGEWGGAALLATENAPARKRALYGSFAQLGAPGADLGLARAHDAENAALGILHDLDFQTFPRRVEIAAGLRYGAVQVLALEFLESIHVKPRRNGLAPRLFAILRRACPGAPCRRFWSFAS